MSQVVLSKDVLRVERVVTSGRSGPDGNTRHVSCNVWVVGDDDTCVVIDAAHDAAPILGAVAGRQVQAVLCTHGHGSHLGAVRQVCAATGAEAYLHPGDRMLWDQACRDAPGRHLSDGDEMEIAGTRIVVQHTPGHSPGSCCFRLSFAQAVFTGDTLLKGGPGATGAPFSDLDALITSIRTRLLTLPPETIVLSGHGEATTVGDEAHLPERIDDRHEPARQQEARPARHGHRRMGVRRAG